MTDNSREKQLAVDWLDDNRAELSDFHLKIWKYAEPAWREYRSAAAYRDLLQSRDFSVEEGSGDMPTAFAARFGGGDPVVGTFAEYDAVPGNSQQPVPYRAPRKNHHPYAPGHTDPHSMLGVAALGGVLAAAQAVEKYNLDATLLFFGEPAEKMCGSKPVHAARGYYDDADAFVAYHPHRRNTVVADTHCGSYWSTVFTFECTRPEEWVEEDLIPGAAGAHTTARCPGATDALCLMYTTTKYTKEAMFPRTGTWTLNEFIIAGGDATADNLPPRFAQIQYAWRSPSLQIQDRIYRVLQNNARQAASATGCSASVRWVTKTRVGLASLPLTELTYRNLQAVGPPRWGEAAREFGRKIQSNLGMEPMDKPYLPTHRRICAPDEYEAALRGDLPDWQANYTSDDYVEYTWHAPTVRLLTARPRLRPPRDGSAYPAWAQNALTGRPEVIDPGMFTAAKTIACTLLDLITQPEQLRRAREEFEKRTGGGIGGSDWVAPLLPEDFPPPVELRWPEYITTSRGEEWCIPSPVEGAMQDL